ncbi:MAG: enolase N-terminal-like fold-containing protein, partial [Armatimonadota bacterium]
MIVDELLNLIGERRRRLEDLTLSRVCVSLCYTAVMLDNSYVGLCHTPIEDIGHSHWGRRRDFHGFKALEIARLANSFDMIERTVGIATLNALSQHLMDSEGYELQFGMDAFDAMDVRREDSVAVVG